MAVSREQVFEVLQRVHPALEQGLPGWSVRPNITGTGAVGLYLDGPELPLMGVNLAGEPVHGICAERFRAPTVGFPASWIRCGISTFWV